MTISTFNNELPDTTSLQSLSLAAARAIGEILEMAIHTDARVSQQEIDTLHRELTLLPGVVLPEDSVLMQTESDFFSQGNAQDRYDGKAAVERIQTLSGDITSDLEMQTCLRLLAVLFCCDGLETSEIEFYQHVVRALGYDYSTADKLLRAAHDSAKVQASAGLEEFPSEEDVLI